MSTKKFNSNIKCTGCIAKVSPALDELLGKGNWEVDLKDPSRTLTTEKEVDEGDINQAIEGIGYHVESKS